MKKPQHRQQVHLLKKKIVKAKSLQYMQLSINEDLYPEIKLAGYIH